MDSIGTRIRKWYQRAPAPYGWLFMLLFIGFWVLFVGFLAASLNSGFSSAIENLPQEILRIGWKLGGLYIAFLVIYALLRFAGFDRGHWKQLNAALKESRDRKK